MSFRKAPPVWIFEEYLADDFMIPTGFKVYAFGEHVAAIRVNVPKEKIGNNDKWDSCSFYLPDWTRSPFIINKYGTTGCGVSGPVEDVPMPAGLEQLILDASTLGEAYGTFCRIDFFMINGMPIFNEFCWYPLAGWGNTLEGEKWLGQIWEEHLGDDKL